MEEKPQTAMDMGRQGRLSSAAAVIDALGGTKAVAELLQVGQSSVSNYRKLGFPARSHFTLSKICAERGLDVADAVFGGYQLKAQTKPYQRATTTNATTTAHGGGNSALNRLEQDGFTRLSLPILQPAAPFIDRMGPEMQRRLFTFTDPGGEQLCLRPDLTIPTALAHIAAQKSGAARYCYQGTAFRYQPRGSGQPEEFTQLGLEIIGGDSGLQDDMDVIYRMLDIIQITGLTQQERVSIKVTDFDMFSFFLSLLDIDDGQKLTVRRAMERARSIDDFTGLMGAQAHVNEPQLQQNLPDDPHHIIAGRSVADIRKRLEMKQEAQERALPPTIIDTIAGFLRLSAMSGGIEKYADQFPEMSKWFSNRVDELAANIAPIMANYLSIERLDFSPGLNKSMAYYTGLSFEIYAQGIDRPIAAGGRYDDLLGSLGAAQNMSAVGGAIALERLNRAIEMQ